LPDGAAPAGTQAEASWEPYADNILAMHSEALTVAAQHHIYLCRTALAHGYITTKQVLEMHQGLDVLFRNYSGFFPDEGRWGPYIEAALRELISADPISSESVVVQDLTAIGEYLQIKPELPWVADINKSLTISLQTADQPRRDGSSIYLSKATYLGAAAVITIIAESRENGMRWTRAEFGQLLRLYPYLVRRHNPFGSSGELPDLPVPAEFEKLFRFWADGKINLIGTKSP
jgi:hypothetical protein